MRGVVVTEFWKKSCRKWCFVACSKFQSNFTPLLIFKNENKKKIIDGNEISLETKKGFILHTVYFLRKQ